ncbi:MAG TPA: aminoacyl-histidine dipeptidase [Firmicutes bacterium]|jgi:dipeptidase D|nr:aminoacyl-histidine dipeptidase [Bacillota bacterium]
MAGILGGLQPEKVFYYFEELSKIPRGSNHEKQVSDFLYQWAQGKNLEVVQDKALNIIIKQPGTGGYENSAAVILQGHMDMVWEKNQATVHDFLHDPLKLRIVGDDIYATGTTLGADDGIAVAYAMAILDSSEIPHPPLEVVFTTDEENGMSGMENLNPEQEQLRGRILINLDCEDEGIFTAGCAGGGRVKFTLPIIKATSQFKNFYKLTVKGLKGGHSGIDIDKERANSIKLLGRILYDLKDNIEIAGIAGGSKANAIPRESWAVVTVNDQFNLEDAINQWNQRLKHELMFTDAEVQVLTEKADATAQVYDEKVKQDIIHLINLIPYGPANRDLERDLVIYSNNLGVIATDEDEKKITFICSPRSSVRSLFNQFIDFAEQLGEILHIDVEIASLYPSWEYAKESKIRDLCLRVYQDVTGMKGQINVIHAGLECGIFMEKIPDLDAISLGPTMVGVHTPNEHLSISSTRRMFEFLCELLKRLK